MTSAVSAPGPAPVLGASTSSATSAATISPASSSGPVPVVIGSLAIHVDRLVVLGFVGGRLVPTSEVVERAFASGVVLSSTCPAVVWMPGICGTIELISSTVEEQDPLVICVAIFGWRRGVDVEKSDGSTTFCDLEGNNL